MGVSRVWSVSAKEKRRRREFADIGDTHNDLRFAASLLSGAFLLGLCPTRFFDLHSARQSVADLNASHNA